MESTLPSLGRSAPLPLGAMAVVHPPHFPRATVPRMAAHTFNVVYEDAGDGWVYAHVPELPELHTQGETLDEAREMARDAIALVLDERRNRGEAIPPTGWALVESVEIAA